MSDGQSEVMEQQAIDAAAAEGKSDREWWDRHARHYWDEAHACILKARAVEAEIRRRFGSERTTSRRPGGS